MTDLPPIDLDTEKRQEILSAVQEVIGGRPKEYQPGDVAVDHIMQMYNVPRYTALRIMKKTVQQNPSLQMLIVTLPWTFNSRVGYVIRKRENPLVSESMPESRAPQLAAPSKS